MDEHHESPAPAPAPEPEDCQRCGRAGVDRRILWMDARGIDELNPQKIPLRRRSVKDTPSSGYEMWGVLLCDDCLDDWLGAFAYWWTRMPSSRIGDIFPDLGSQSARPWPRAAGPSHDWWGDGPPGSVWESEPQPPAT